MGKPFPIGKRISATVVLVSTGIACFCAGYPVLGQVSPLPLSPIAEKFVRTALGEIRRSGLDGIDRAGLLADIASRLPITGFSEISEADREQLVLELSGHPPSPAIVKALGKLARGYFLQGREVRAREMLLGVFNSISRQPDGGGSGESTAESVFHLRLQIASIYLALGEIDNALRISSGKRFQDSVLLAGIRIRAARRLFDQGNPQGADDLLKRR